jgi:hypothetical protein
MATVLRNVKNVLLADKKEMLGDEWKSLAISNDESRDFIHQTHGEFAADGFRMHVVKDGSTCGCVFDEQMKTTFKTCKKDALFSFAVNRQFLIDALAGIGSGSDGVFFFSSGRNKPVVLSNDNGDRIAVIMPLGIERDPSLE